VNKKDLIASLIAFTIISNPTFPQPPSGSKAKAAQNCNCISSSAPPEYVGLATGAAAAAAAAAANPTNAGGARPILMSPTQTVDIRKCPQAGEIVDHAGKIYTEDDYVTMGDLHGNFGKFVYFLVKEGMASFQDPQDCQKLLDLYYRSPKATAFPVDPVLDDLISKINIMRPPQVPNVRLIGDELGDRGKNDGLIIKLMSKLFSAQPGAEVIASNHSIFFMRMINGVFGGVDDAFLSAKQTDSMRSIFNKMFSKTSLMPTDQNELENVKKFINEDYLDRLKLVSVTNHSSGKKTVFTHAPSGDLSLIKAASELNINEPLCLDPLQLKTNLEYCVNLINQTYRAGLKKPYNVDPKNLGRLTLDEYIGEYDKKDLPGKHLLDRFTSTETFTAKDKEDLRDPLADIFWRRHGDQFNPRWSPAPAISRWDTANGHDLATTGSDLSTFELDNILGKGDGFLIGEYYVLRPQ
jgi:hypothetical protein